MRLMRVARRRRTEHVALRGYDSDPAAVRAAIENSERAKLRGFVHFERRELDNRAGGAAATGLVAANPPYGERIGDQERLQALYALLGASCVRTSSDGRRRC